MCFLDDDYDFDENDEEYLEEQAYLRGEFEDDDDPFDDDYTPYGTCRWDGHQKEMRDNHVDDESPNEWDTIPLGND